MVYVDSRNLGYEPFIWKWLRTRPKPEEATILRSLFEKYAKACVDWVLEGVDGDELVKRPRQSVPVTNLNMITQLCSLLETLLADDGKISGDPQVRCVECQSLKGLGAVQALPQALWSTWTLLLGTCPVLISAASDSL
jgi:hypothetical protein